MEKDMVNIIVHGHDPSLSEMIVMYSQDPEMIALAKSVGAKGINIAGVCCTGNEVAMRQGIPMAGNFLQQENVVLTGACEAIAVEVLPHQVHHHLPHRPHAGLRFHRVP